MKIDKELYEKVSKKTMTNYKPLYDKDPDIDYVIVFEDGVNGMLDDLLYEIEYLEEKYEDLKNDLEDNYVPRYKDKYEEYGVSKKDFY